VRSRHPMRIAVALAAAAATAAAGVGIAAAGVSVSAMTAQKSDLPSGFRQTFSHGISVASTGARGATRHGFVSGWQRSFTRVQDINSAVLTSSALEYANQAAAHRSVQSIWRNVLDRTSAKRIIIGRDLGFEARAFVYRTGTGITTYAIAWRYKNIDAVVLLVGLRSVGVTADLATRIALRQQRHISLERG
jgi:hypothetical protein